MSPFNMFKHDVIGRRLIAFVFGGIAGGVSSTGIAAERSIDDAPGIRSVAVSPSPGYRVVRPDFSVLKSREVVSRSNSRVLLKLPLPEGGETEFYLSDSGTLPPALAQRYPQILSMKGHDARGRRIRLDMSDGGVRAIVFDQDGTWLLQPQNAVDGSPSDKRLYLSFRERAAPVLFRTAPQPRQWKEVIRKLPSTDPSALQNKQSRLNDRNRDYRIAIAATSAWSRYFGGTVSSSLASVVEVLNRVNAVFERDLGIHLTLVENNDKIIFTNPAIDPYVPPPGNPPGN